MNEKKSGNRGAMIAIVVVVGGLSALACTGILAAIAIPAFLRFENMSKVSEANAMLMQIGSFAEMHFAEHCKFPTFPLVSTSDPTTCCGGKKCIPTANNDVWDAGVPQLTQPSYFTYESEEQGNTLEIRATADFNCGGPMHTLTLTIEGDPESCSTSRSVVHVDNALD